MRQRAIVVVTFCVVAIFPYAGWAQIAGEWEVRVNKIIKKPPRDDPDTLNSKFEFEYRYGGGLPPARFLVANGFSPQAFPQTLQSTSLERNSFDLVLADIYEVCPGQFEVIEEEGQTIGVATLRIDANIGFPPSRRPGKPFHQLIVHDWGDVYEGLGEVSVLNFGTSLESMVLSAGLMMRDFRCAEATAEECVAVINASIRAMEPTQEQIDRGVHGGQEFHGCPRASDSSSAAEPSTTADPATSFTLASSAFKDEAVIQQYMPAPCGEGKTFHRPLLGAMRQMEPGCSPWSSMMISLRVELETTHASIAKSATFPPMYPRSRKDKP